MSVELLELGAAVLGDLADEVVFVGGATVSLWITDPGAPSPRPTKDVDVIVEVATRADYHAFEERLRGAGFRDDGQIICRWRHPQSGLILDAMPTDAELLGFENRWQREAFPHAELVPLPSGAEIRAVSPAFMLATKLEAYAGRGGGDLLGSRDFADIVALVDGREELQGEVVAAPIELRSYVQASIRELLSSRRLLDGVRAQLRPDTANQARAEPVVVARLRAIADATHGRS
jgi:predicted nucleotidyltransferase